VFEINRELINYKSLLPTTRICKLEISTQNTMAPIKVGLMGYGFSTKTFHLPFLHPNPDFEVYAFLQRASAPTDKTGVEPGKHCTVDYPHAKHYRTADEFFADPNIDLVVVCTHHDTHAQFAEKALLAGKHGR
jgi:predicted dehydrogenase